MPFEWFKRLEIPDVVLVKFRVFEDARGFFAELYKRTDFLSEGIPYDFVQVNLSYSRRGVVRGLHYQLRPAEQGKLVYVVSGRVFDVAVDIRRGSPWFGKYVAVTLEPGYALWIPRLRPRIPGTRGDLLPLPGDEGVQSAARKVHKVGRPRDRNSVADQGQRDSEREGQEVPTAEGS